MLLRVGLINISDRNSTQKIASHSACLIPPQNESGHLGEFDDKNSWAIGPFGIIWGKFPLFTMVGFGCGLGPSGLDFRWFWS